MLFRSGYLDNIAISNIKKFEKELFSILLNEYSGTLDALEKEKSLSDTFVSTLTGVIERVRKLFVEE